MIAKARHLLLGAAGEDAAARYLAGRGWRIRDRNWRPAGPRNGLELDIVAESGGVLIFVEVKTRSSGPGDEADGRLSVPVHAAFDARKMKRLLHAARHYLTIKELWARPCRFDLICARRKPDGRMELEHHDNVIEIGHIVDSGDAAWQPW